MKIKLFLQFLTILVLMLFSTCTKDDVTPINELNVDSKYLKFDYYTEKKEIYLKNSGNVIIDWQANYPEYFVLNPNNGKLLVNDSVLVEISVNRNNLETGIYDSIIEIVSIENEIYNIYTSLSNFNESKWIIDKNIVDAEFCKEINRLITISSNPNCLSIIDVDSKKINDIVLNNKPNCVSVSNDGSFAVVGNNGSLTYIDLISNSIDKEYVISCNSCDVAIGENKWTYVTPAYEQWTFLSCIEYSTGIETFHKLNITTDHIFGDSRVKVQPNSEYIYLGNIWYMEKMDISDGTASYLYDVKDTFVKGNFWFTENGERVLTLNKSIFSTSIVQGEDLQYFGKLDTKNTLWWIHHSEDAGRIYTITTDVQDVFYDEGSKVEVFDDTYFHHINDFELEQFIVPIDDESARLEVSMGRFVFANKLGTKLYVILQANDDSGITTNNWAIQTLSME